VPKPRKAGGGKNGFTGHGPLYQPPSKTREENKKHKNPLTEGVETTGPKGNLQKLNTYR